MTAPRPSRLRSLRAILRFMLLALTACRPAPALPTSDGMVPLDGGGSLRYRTVGAGPDTVVVLHGGPMLDSRYLEDVLGPLGSGHTLLFYDQRGRGRSVDAPGDSLSLDRDAADLETVRRHFGLGRFAAVAHHWGSAILFKHTLSHPGHLTRAALLAPFPPSGPHFFELIRAPNDSAALAAHLRAREARSDTTDPAGYCRRFWGMSFSPMEETDPAVIGALAPLVCEDEPARLLAREGRQRLLAASLGTWDWGDSLAALQVPTLVIVGTGSTALMAGAEVWAARAATGRLLRLGRSPVFPWVEAPDATREALRRFLDGGWPDAAGEVQRSTAAVISS